MREKRDEIIILRTTKAEKSRIYEKMLGMGICSLSAYIRKMALDGYCLHLVRLCWPHWRKKSISRSLSNRSAATMTRMVMPGERKTG